MWIDFALNANDRGQAAVKELTQYTEIFGKKFLDVGCAYGGFLVAFARSGAKHVTGLDINPALLRLASANLEDHNVSAALHEQNLLDPQVLELGTFDIITCNDVIEHVENPALALSHLSSLLGEGGVLYMEIPNHYFAGFLKEDGHYKLPGITLLPRQRAAEYYAGRFEGCYDVAFYRKLDYYLYHLRTNGVSPTLMNQDEEPFDLHRLHEIFQEALSTFHSFREHSLDPRLVREIQAKGEKIYGIFSREVQAYEASRRENPRQARTLAQRIHRRYGIAFWKIIASKQRRQRSSASIWGWGKRG
jgi:SAM-dependent methyltransferase